MAIHPYPAHLVQETRLKNGMPMTIRPIRPEDAEMITQFVERLSEETRYNRYMSTLKSLSQVQLVRFTQIDYAREMALVSTVISGAGEIIVAVARFVVNIDSDSCEFAIVIDDQWQGKGLGVRLMERLFAAARDMACRPWKARCWPATAICSGLCGDWASKSKPTPKTRPQMGR